MNLVVDSGNSAAKVGIFDDLILKEKLSFDSWEDLGLFLEKSSHENILVSSVKADAQSVLSRALHARNKFALTKDLPLPVQNRYSTPASLGMDRLAAVCGARQFFPRHDCLVIDAGTCVTYDFIDKAGNYLGGGISPGLKMRFQAVHTFTAKLPLVSPKAGVPLIGDSTETSIQSGVGNGLLAEIDGIIDRYQKKYPGLSVILCGGDTGFFENQTKASIFASPELVLIGLNSILIYNVNRS
jgi:type III pantothenate kinase